MEQKQLPEDFKEFINSLNSNKVKYMLVGGWAVGIYGHPRATKDIDFFVSIDDRNLKRLKKALAEFGSPAIDMENFKEIGNIFRMGRSHEEQKGIRKSSGFC